MNHSLRARSAHDVGEGWTAADATELYEIARWGKGYFAIGENGQVKIHPTKDASRSIDLKQLVDDLQLRGISLPTLIRFRDILQHRLQDISEAFQRGDRAARVLRPLHLRLPDQGQPAAPGRRGGARSSAASTASASRRAPSRSCWRWRRSPTTRRRSSATASRTPSSSRWRCWRRRSAAHIIPVVEKYTELDLILEYAEKVGVRPTIGMRVKLAARGGGRWQSSGGYRSKFGLTVGEILRGLEELKTRGMEDCFQLLHFHLGSQIPNIRIVKGALNEAARVYVELVKAGAGLKYMDVGGGLGVDYDGSQTNFESSVNYTLQEYANDVVYHLQTVCDEAKVPHPTIVSESGRAIVAHHSVLVFNVLGVSGFGDETLPKTPDAGDGAAAHRPDRDLRRPDVEKRARELPRRAAGARHGDEPVLGRLPAARSAIAGREPLLGDLPASCRSWCRRWTKCPRICRTSTSRCRTPTSATSRCSSRFPTAGRSSSSSRSCRSTG